MPWSFALEARPNDWRASETLPALAHVYKGAWAVLPRQNNILMANLAVLEYPLSHLTTAIQSASVLAAIAAGR